MNPHQNPGSHGTSYILRLLAATLITAAIAATAACSGEQPPPTHRPQTSDRNLSKTIEAMASEIETLHTKVANPSHTASVVTLLQGQETFGSNTVNLDELPSDKPLIINFWAADSPSSHAELPELQEFYDEYQGRVLILLVEAELLPYRGNPEQALDQLKELDITIPAGYAENPAILKKYQISGLPTTLFIDTEDQIQDRWTGVLNKQVLTEKTRTMLGYEEVRHNCDDILKNQFVFQRNASTAEALNAVISVIQNQRVDQCSVDVWNPTAANASQHLGCFTHETIGNQDVPSGLHRTATDPRARLNSGRDRDNNIIVHWSRKPADETNCWLYVARLSTWSVE